MLNHSHTAIQRISCLAAEFVEVAAGPVLRGEIGTANPAFAVPNPFANSIRTADSRFPYGAPAGGRGGVPGGEALTRGCGQEQKATISHSTF